jgi:hypothetical protein
VAGGREVHPVVVARVPVGEAVDQDLIDDLFTPVLDVRADLDLPLGLLLERHAAERAGERRRGEYGKCDALKTSHGHHP